MNFNNFHVQPSFSVSIISQSSQPISVNKPEQDIGYLAGVFVTFMIIGFLLGCFLEANNHRKQRHQRSIEIIRTIKSLDHLQGQVPNLEQKLTTESSKQIEILEKIWQNSL